MGWTEFLQLLIMIVALLFVAATLVNAEKDSPRDACEAAHPGRACQTVWVPKP